MKTIIIAICVSISSVLANASLVVDFEDMHVNKAPTNWKIETTGAKKNLATWQIEKEAHNKILTLQKVDASGFFFGGTFNLCYLKDVLFKDGEISVKFRANSGKIDQGGGIMWRVQDKDNYLVVRFNPLEDNFRFYSVIEGTRSELKSANVTLTKGWHTMTIKQHADGFEGYIDGKKELEAKSDAIKDSGSVGVWTKADAATSFDDLKIKELSK